MRFVSLRWTTLLALTLVLLASGQAEAEDWPQFRGVNCSGISLSKKPLPLEFSATKNVRWSAVLLRTTSG
jgi:hypothetical protein